MDLALIILQGVTIVAEMLERLIQTATLIREAQMEGRSDFTNEQKQDIIADLAQQRKRYDTFIESLERRV
jgi:hypothetical protein